MPLKKTIERSRELALSETKAAVYWEWGARGGPPAYGEFCLDDAEMTFARSVEVDGGVVLRYDPATGALIGVIVPLTVTGRSIPEWLAEE